MLQEKKNTLEVKFAGAQHLTLDSSFWEKDVLCVRWSCALTILVVRFHRGRLEHPILQRLCRGVERELAGGLADRRRKRLVTAEIDRGALMM